ncbi:hypothetical protein M2101_001934 [Parabacteroides sp. PM5-20]|nr:hypothetical protein [Parabacteroides sp. PM5-20]MDH6535252.1 hypothetical protein [Parabacteroides sp. PM5-20]
MSSSFKILFYIKKNQVNKNGKCTIMVRLSINGTRWKILSSLTPVRQSKLILSAN